MAEKPTRKKWIAKATKGAHGQFRAKAERAGESTREYAEQEKGASGKTGKQARLALALMGASGADRRKKLYNHPRSRAHD